MLKKMKAAAEKTGVGSVGDISQAVLDSSHQIWLAGLGAFVRAQQEGMRMFETLVKQGEGLERKTRAAASATATAAKDAAATKAKEMQQMAGGTWDKLEQVFEDRVARALSKLGVYTQNDVQKLAERVDQLSARVNELLKANGKAAPARKGARRKAAAKKPRAAKGGKSAR
jgi:poly(hydroxyalkanoate) granule-associated protein